MMITMKPSRLLTATGVALATTAATTAPAVAVVPHDEGTVIVANPWPLPARALQVTVASGCTYVDDVPTIPSLQVTTRDPEWVNYLNSTFHLSSGIPFIHTRADVSWRNVDTGATGSGSESGLNGSVPGAVTWSLDPGRTEVTVTITQSPGVPLEIGVIGSRTATGTFEIDVLECGVD